MDGLIWDYGVLTFSFPRGRNLQEKRQVSVFAFQHFHLFPSNVNVLLCWKPTFE